VSIEAFVDKVSTGLQMLQLTPYRSVGLNTEPRRR